MARYPSPGVRLARLADHRKLDVRRLSRLTEVGEPELRAVFEGTAPNPTLLRRLAPAFDLHAADLFAIADIRVPDDLAPLDANAAEWVPELVWCAVRLPAEHRRRLRRLVRSLPQRNRTQPPRVYERSEPGFGTVLWGLLGNRNLDWPGTAQVTAQLTEGQVYVAASTIARVGRGIKEPAPDLLAGLATTLGIPAADLAALSGVEPTDGTVPRNPAASDIVDLIWDLRRLTADQVRLVERNSRALTSAGIADLSE